MRKTPWRLSVAAIFLAGFSAHADISGKVYKDFNFNGTFDGGDAPVIGVPVTAVCSDGQSYSAVTDANGDYTLSGFPSGSKCRVEVDPSSQGVGSGTNAPGSSPLVDIVSDGQTHDVSTGSPATYCQANPDVVMAVLPGYFTRGIYGVGGGESPIGKGLGSVFKVPAPQTGEFNNNGTIGGKRTTLALIDQTGAIWGAAWQKSTKSLFVSAALKRYVPLKDESSPMAVQQSAGTIYKIDTVANTVTPFTVVANVLSTQAATDLASRDYSYNQDRNIIKYTGRMGLGDLEISEDETKLYTVNMNTKELVIIDAGSGAILQNVPIPNPYANGECSDAMVRPWALKVRGADVFIGSVCEDGIENNVGAAIQKYNGSIFQTIAKTNSLRYARPYAYNPAGKDPNFYRYENWGNDLTDGPMLTDIEFTNNGDLVLGYNSRATYNRATTLRGDIRKMCLNADGTYTDEIASVDPDIPSSTCKPKKQNINGRDFYEFYIGDYFGGDYGATGHPDTASGALAQAPGAPNIIVGMIDGTDWWQPGAIGNYDNVTGDKIGAQAVVNKDTYDNDGEREPYGAKAGGMGDVELLCDPAPIEIGNYVWMDLDQDGIQDPGEPPFAGVNVTLTCNGTQIGTAVTDAKGHYYFGGPTNANLNPGAVIGAGQSCTLSIAQADVNGKPPTVTDPNGNADDIRDNDAAANGANNEIVFTTTAFNDHSLDFGIEPTLGCVTGRLFQDNNGDGLFDGTDTVAPAGITVSVTDAYGNVYSAVTDTSGNFMLENIPVGAVTVQVDTTDTDIPEGAVWANYTASINLTESTPAGAPAVCSRSDFPYTLPAPTDQDPKDTAVCANPTSLTWDGATVSTATVWQNMLTNPLTTTTAGGISVGVSMSINNPDNEFYDTDTANNSGSGTSAAFGQPYLTLYLGDQSSPGDGDYLNSDGAGCAAHGYDLEAGERAELVVEFDQEVILDNWRIRDVDSGDLRGGTPNWEWQDGIIVQGYDADNNPVEIETKIGSSGVGLIKDAQGIVHSDPNSYVATNGAGWDDGDGVTPNSTNGHIVLASNFVPVKRIVITHVAGPDMPCQTRSALAMAGFAVCVPLKISGTVYNDEDGVSVPAACDTSDNTVDGTPISTVEGENLNACLVDTNGIVVDTQVVDANGAYVFDKRIVPNTTYKVLLTTQACHVGQSAPDATLPNGWNYEGEQIDPANNTGHDGTPDGTIEVVVTTSNATNVDFAINKSPVASDYTEQTRINPAGAAQVPFAPSLTDVTSLVFDSEETLPARVRIAAISGGTLYYQNSAVATGTVIDNPDVTQLYIDPDNGDVTATFTYQVMDKACRLSENKVFTAPFIYTGTWSGNVSEDTDNDDSGELPIEGVTIELYSDPDCNGDRSDGALVDTTLTDANGDYSFTGVDLGCYVAVETQPAGFIDVVQRDGGLDGDALGSTPVNEISGRIDAGESDEGNDFVEERPGSLCGKISEDINNDEIGEVALSNVTLTLFDANGNQVGTTTTDSNGEYCFMNLPAGDYTVVETQPDGYIDVSEKEGGDDGDKGDNGRANAIDAKVDAAERDEGNDFVEERPGSLCGKVSEDTNGDGTGDQPIANVTLTLFDANGNQVGTTTTDSNGEYCFMNLPAGDYTVVETQPDGYIDVSEKEGGDDGDKGDNGRANAIDAKVDAAERDEGNDFVEERVGSACGYVLEDTDNDNIGDRPIAGVTLELYKDINGNGIVDQNEALEMTTQTDESGRYCFNDIVAGDYVILERQPDGYIDVSEKEGGDDGDKGDNGVKNAIAVKVDVKELDDGNNFVEEKPDKAYRIGDLFWVDANANGKYDAGETVIAGAKVELLDANGNVIAQTVTDAQGRYRFDVPAGQYGVRFHIPQKYLDEGYGFVSVRGEGDETNKASQNGIIEQPIEVGPGIATENLTLDAAIACSCGGMSSDSADAWNNYVMIAFGLLSVFVGMQARRREVEKRV